LTKEFEMIGALRFKPFPAENSVQTWYSLWNNVQLLLLYEVQVKGCTINDSLEDQDDVIALLKFINDLPPATTTTPLLICKWTCTTQLKAMSSQPGCK
jgi:hypothetical protein